MLKIDCISLAKNGFDVIELGHLAGKVVMKNGDAEIAAGKFRMSNGGMCTMCAMDLAGASLDTEAEVAEGEAFPVKPIVLDKPSDLTVELTADVVREFELQAGETDIDLGCEDLEDCTVLMGSTELTPSSGKVTVTATDKDRVVTLTLKDLKVGKGVAKEPNAGHKIAITPDNPEGLFHIAALCNVGNSEGHKPNKTHFECRGLRPWKVMGEPQCVAFKAPAEANDPEE